MKFLGLLFLALLLLAIASPILQSSCFESNPWFDEKRMCHVPLSFTRVIPPLKAGKGVRLSVHLQRSKACRYLGNKHDVVILKKKRT